MNMKIIDPKVSTYVGLSAELRARLDAFAVQLGVSRSWLCQRVLQEWLAVHSELDASGPIEMAAAMATDLGASPW
jgi:predicted transcriptional regulator